MTLFFLCVPPSSLLLLLNEQYANYVMQKAPDCADTGGCKISLFPLFFPPLLFFSLLCFCCFSPFSFFPHFSSPPPPEKHHHVALVFFMKFCFSLSLYSPPLNFYDDVTPMSCNFMMTSLLCHAGQGKRMVYHIRPHLATSRFPLCYILFSFCSSLTNCVAIALSVSHFVCGVWGRDYTYSYF